MTTVPRHDVPRRGRSGYLKCGDRQVHYLTWGRLHARPVVLLHGAGQSGYMYEKLGAALGEDYYVLAPDLPDHGDSDPLSDDRWTRPDLAGAIIEFLDEFDLGPAAFVGTSLGGITAIGIAAIAPQRVSRLVLIDVAHRVNPVGRDRIAAFFAATESFGSLEEAATVIARYFPGRDRGSVESLRRNLRQLPDGRWVWKHGMARRHRAAEALISERAAGTIDVLLDQLDTEASRLSCPVLLLRGAVSDVLSAEAAAELGHVIPRGSVAVVPSAGHSALSDNPTLTIAYVADFLARTQAETP